MHQAPTKASVELVALATGQDLTHLDRDAFIAAVERLAAEAEREQSPHPVREGTLVVTLETPGLLEAAVLAAVLATERGLRLN